MDAMILSGGQGTRLRPLTLGLPKPLLPIANRPFLSYPSALLRRCGVADIVLCIAHDAAPYSRLVRREKGLGTRIACSREPSPLGTAGAVKNAERRLRGSGPFVVMNGDALTNIDLKAMLRFHRARRSRITIALMPVPDPSLYGLVTMDGRKRVRRFVEKPRGGPRAGRSLINIGIYIFERDVLNLIPRGRAFSAERELFPLCIARGLPVHGYTVASSTYWLDIGTPGKFLQANLDIVRGRCPGVLDARSWSRVGKGTRIARDSSVGEDVVLGSRCRVGPGSSLSRCVLLDGVTVGPQAAVENCVIGSGCSIGAHSRVTSARVLGDRSVITPYSAL